MKSTEARAIAMSEIPAILVKAKLIEGDTLDPDQVKTAKEVLFWNKKVTTEVASSKTTFITWNIISTDAIAYADNRVASRRVYVSIEIFTKMADIDEKVQKLLAKIDKQMVEHGWEFEMIGTPAWDSTNNLNQLSYSAIKKL